MSKTYEVDFSYDDPIIGSIVVVADDADDADYEATMHITRSYPEAINIEIIEVREIELD